jgi:iron complex outermembrane recepter protein
MSYPGLTAGVCVCMSVIRLFVSDARVSDAQSQPPRTYTTARDSVAKRKRDSIKIVIPVTVTGTREARRRSESSATVDMLSEVEIRRVRASHPSGIMNRLAGVHITELSGEGHSTAIRQPLTTNAVYLFLEDGVPTRSTGFFNHNALYEVNLPQAGGIEVLKGPGTSLYGSDAIGGIVNVLTRPAPARPTIETSLESGAHGYARLLSTGGFRNASNGFRGDLNITRSAGWRDGSAYSRQSGTLRWERFTESGWAMRTTMTGTAVDQHDVPTLTIAQYNARSTINLAPIAFREVRAARLSSAMEREGDRSLVSFTPYARYDALELLPYWQLSYDKQVWDTRNTSVGALLKYRRDFDRLRSRLIVGTDIDFSPGSFVANEVISERANGIFATYIKGAAQHDYDVTYHSVAPYLHSEINPLPRLRLDAGLRYDISGYSYDTHLEPVSTGVHRIPASTSVRYTHFSPKIGVTYDISSAFNLYSSYRHGFRAPSQSQLFQQNSADNTVTLKPVRAESFELGVRGHGDRYLYQLSAYHMRKRDDILTYVTPLNTREARNAGETAHQGLEASAGALLTRDLRLDLSYSLTDQRYVSWTPEAARPGTGESSPVAAVDYSGNRIEQAPRDMGTLTLTYAPRVLNGGSLSTEATYLGPYAMDPLNTHYYAGHAIVHLRANYPITRRAELFARVINLLNRRYAELTSYDPFQKEQFNPGGPRCVFVGLQYGWVKR